MTSWRAPRNLLIIGTLGLSSTDTTDSSTVVQYDFEVTPFPLFNITIYNIYIILYIVNIIFEKHTLQKHTVLLYYCH